MGRHARTPVLTGKTLGDRYTILVHIAQGGMGEVWKARDRETGRLVAAKILRPELSGQELSLSRLRIEASNAMRIQHPNVANVLDSGEEDGRGWIIMELVEGRPLTSYLAGGQRIAPKDLLPLLMQIAMALGAAERAGVVHRDIKPANVLVRADGVVKLTDFGISRTLDQITLTADGMVMGTAQYLAPEQAMGEPATSLGDLYALGVIAYEALVGRRPFTGATQVDIAFAHVNDVVPPVPLDVPEPFAEVVLHLLEKNPAHRPPSGTALARELMAVANKLGLDIAPHPLPLPHGTEETIRTAPQPVVAPVRHERRSRLPADMLAPVDMNVEITRPPARRSKRSLSHRVDTEGLSVDTAAPATGASGPAPSTGASVADTPPTTGESRFRRRADLRRAATPPPDTKAAPPSPMDKMDKEARKPSPEARRDSAPTQLPRRAAPKAGPRWRCVDSTPVRQATPAPPAKREETSPGPDISTKYNRSVVAPPTPLSRRIGQWTIIILVVITLILVAAATIHNRIGTLPSILGQGTISIEEDQTWQSPWPTT